MSGAVSSYQQCKLCWKLGRAAYLQRSTSFGLVTNEAGNREPAEFNASWFQTASTPVFSECIVAFQTHRSPFLIRRPQSSRCQPFGDVVGRIGLPCPTLHACAFAATQGEGFGLCSNPVDPFRDPLFQ
jgi:hypothetical protein